MIGKVNWSQYLHEIRKREIEITFSLLGPKRFASGLEVGAGDGYQTTLLAPHIKSLISSDLNFKRIKEALKVPLVSYKVIDADKIEGSFPDNSFDFIFSSNVLEHVRDPYTFLASTFPMLQEDGVAVHIVPSRHIKIFYILLYYPYMALLSLDRIIGSLKGKPFFQGEKINLENNINVDGEIPKSQSRSRRLKKFLLPSIHGNFPSHTKEFKAYGRKQWESMFRKAGYSIINYAKGPAFSGYGFGASSLQTFLELCGVSSEHIFILKKQSEFELQTREYTKKYLPRGSNYEHEKFIEDWMNKEKNAKAFVKDFTNAVGDPRDKKILDVGFGNGIMLLEFARSGAKVTGLETESKLVDVAEKKFKDNNLEATLKTYDGKTFPFPDNNFDYCYSTSVFEHMSYPEIVLSEISRTLKPGGKFYLSVPNKYALKESHTGLWFISLLPRSAAQFILKLFKSSPLEDWNLHFISYFSLKKMARSANLQIVYDTNSRSKAKQFIKKLFAQSGLHYGMLLKTMIIVLEKPLKKLENDGN